MLLAILLALTAVRVIGLHTSVVDLFFDEAQYWAWSRELAFGYFSKPPLLAWIIAASDHLCGSGEACVRLASPLFYLATSLVVYAIADELYGKETAFWSALTFALLTGVSFSTRIISTDVPLLFFWALALFAYLKLLAGPDWRWALVLGAALGFGLLAKYAMIYFALGVACAAWLDRDARDLLKRPQTWTAFAIAFVILSPNIYWNIANQFATFKHTGENITGTGLRFRPFEALTFFGSQFAVAGPLIFAAFLLIAWQAFRGKVTRQDRLMLDFRHPAFGTGLCAFVLPRRQCELGCAYGAIDDRAGGRLVAAERLSRMDACLTRHRRHHAGRAAAGGRLCRSHQYRCARTQQRHLPAHLGWRRLGEEVTQLARAHGAPTVAADGRAEQAALTYYLRNEPLAVVSWARGAQARSQFDLTQALDDAAKEPVLLFTGCTSPRRLARFYADVTPLPRLTVQTGPQSNRRYAVFKLARRQHPIEPPGPCP